MMLNLDALLLTGVTEAVGKLAAKLHRAGVLSSDEFAEHLRDCAKESKGIAATVLHGMADGIEGQEKPPFAVAQHD